MAAGWVTVSLRRLLAATRAGWRVAVVAHARYTEGRITDVGANRNQDVAPARFAAVADGVDNLA